MTVRTTTENLLRINWELLPVVLDVVDCVATVVLIASSVDKVLLEQDVTSEEQDDSVVATSSLQVLDNEDCCSQMKFQAVLQGYCDHNQLEFCTSLEKQTQF